MLVPSEDSETTKDEICWDANEPFEEAQFVTETFRRELVRRIWVLEEC